MTTRPALRVMHDGGRSTLFVPGRHTDLSDDVDTRTVRPRGFVLGERAAAIASER